MIDVATYCPRKFAYAYVRKIRLPKTGSMALGHFMHKTMEKHFYNEKGQPKYKSAQTFSNASANRWRRYVIETGEIEGEPIEWRDQKEFWLDVLEGRYDNLYFSGQY